MLVSLGTLLYPFVSNYMYDSRTDTIITEYKEIVDSAGDEERQRMWADADRYNRVLRKTNIQLTDPFEAEALEGHTKAYRQVLNLNEAGVMGYLDIPKIDVYLPIYHGTDAETLEKGIGHLEGSSVPVGGKSTHSVISGHTGLKSARMLTDLVEMKEGDHFYLHTLGETLAYQVNQIKVVTPDQVSDLLISDGKDFVTIITCTPYGVNSHRLLVRGTRVELEPEEVEQILQEEKVEGVSVWMAEYAKALIAGVGIVLLLVIVSLIRKRVRK